MSTQTPAPAVGVGLRARRLGVALSGRRVLDGIDLDVAAGEWLGVIGPNGAGKTTLLRALAGLQRHDGMVAVGGRRVTDMAAPDRARQLAVVPQEPVLPPDMMVFDYLLLGRTPHLGRRLAVEASDERIVAAVAQRLDLDDHLGRRLGRLSGGERQRVVIGRGLVQDPAVLLLDEPTSSLDLGHQQEVLELVDDLRRERGLTVVMTLHDLNLAAQFADRLALVVGGRMVAAGTPSEVLDPELLHDAYGATLTAVDGPDGLLIVPLRRR